MSLPQGWRECLLSDYVIIKNGFAFKSNDYQEEGIPLIRISDIQNQKVLIDKAVRVSEDLLLNSFQIEKEDLLIAMSGATTGKIGIYYEDAYILQNQRVGNIKLKDEENGDKGFRNYLIQSLSDKILDIAYGGAQPNISPKVLGSIRIFLPPLAEQKQISKKLDKLLVRVERIKMALDNAPARIKRFRQSVLSSAVGGAWKEVTIDDILENIRYGTSKKCSYDDTLTPVLRIPNIKDSKINTEDIKSASFNEKEFETLALKVGDILIIRSNGSIDLVGKNVVVTDEHENYIFAGYLIRVRLNLTLAHPKYIHYSLSSPQTREVINLTAKSTSGVNNLNSKEIGSFKVFLPPLKEQKAIVKKVETLFAIADKMEANLLEAKKRVDRLTQSILAKAFRGEL